MLVQLVTASKLLRTILALVRKGIREVDVFQVVVQMCFLGKLFVAYSALVQVHSCVES